MIELIYVTEFTSNVLQVFFWLAYIATFVYMWFRKYKFKKWQAVTRHKINAVSFCLSLNNLVAANGSKNADSSKSQLIYSCNHDGT